MRNDDKNLEGFSGNSERGNGIVNIMGTKPEKSFPIYYEKNNTENSYRSLGNIHGENRLNTTFFSKENLDSLTTFN